MPDIPDEARERIDEQTRQQTARTGVQRNQRHVEERKFNSSFLERIQDPDVDSEIHDWLRDEFPSLFSGAHILGQRSQEFEKQQEYLNRAKAEKFIAEENTGSLLRRHPDVHATMNGDDATNAGQYESEIGTDQKRVVRSSMEVATTRQSLAVGARGLRSVTTATSETRTVRQESDEDSGGLLASATGVFG
jgi:hypothetical protein